MHGARELVEEGAGAHEPALDPRAAAAIHALDEEKEAAYRAIVAARFPIMDAARELVAALRADGFRTAVGSSGPPLNVARAIEGLALESAFDAVVTGRDVVRSKPDPECFLLAASRVVVDPARCGVFEDAPAGIVADLGGYQAVVPGDPEASALIERILTDDEEEITDTDTSQVQEVMEGGGRGRVRRATL